MHDAHPPSTPSPLPEPMARSMYTQWPSRIHRRDRLTRTTAKLDAQCGVALSWRAEGQRKPIDED